MITDWDDAYTNGKYIEGSAGWPDRWAADAAAFRDRMQAAGRMTADIAYGSAPRNKADLFLPQGTPAGLAVFIHGGYWHKFDKAWFSHFAEGAVSRGWAVAMPSYTLCPDIRIAGITREIGAAIDTLAGMVAGPIRIAGHSAGGHLVSRMMCADSPLGGATRDRIAHVLSLSGVHDLRPLLRATDMNTILAMDAAEAEAESPCLREPLAGIPLTAWVGGAERPEFVRQNALLANIWTGLGAETRCIVEPARHHFDVIDGLIDPQSQMTAAFIGTDGWPG
ncbi:MAG: alpha/beta hydrolase [Brucellaceae bacterium]|nr:alpha/beta hydrolase [Brucellaceae bacterium]